MKVVESVMAKSPKLITGDLPRWLANHSFDQNSDDYTHYEVAREQAFQYLTFFATERVLNDALSIVKANEHYKVDSRCLLLQVPGFLPSRSLQQAQRSPGICEGEK